MEQKVTVLALVRNQLVTDVHLMIPSSYCHSHFLSQDNPADRYKYPKEMGILTQIPSPSNFKLMDIINRIQKKQQEFQQKIERKKKAEREWFENKYQTTTNGNIGNGVQK